MKNVISFKSLLVLFLLSASVISINAQAQPQSVGPTPTAEWVSVTPTTSPIIIDWIQASTLKHATVSYAPFASIVLSYDDNVTDQSPANIRQVFMEELGSLASDFPDLLYVSGCDKPTTDCTNASGTTASGTYSNTFTSEVAFNYLAVHFGQGELLFKFDTAQTAFSIGGLPRGLSNYRAYVDLVPEPETYALMLIGLGFMSFFARKRKTV